MLMGLQLHDQAKQAAQKVGVTAVEVSISHDDAQAVAVAVARL